MIRSVLLRLMYFVIVSNKNVTANAPKIAKIEIVIFSEKIVIPSVFNTKIPNATPSVEPEEIPKTEGPANGFLNKVCINNPDKAIPAPHKIAVTVLGILNL